MSAVNDRLAKVWSRLGPRFLPFADGASATLPLSQLLRLSLFQISVGMSLVLLNGTLNRVMIVELGVVASVVATMVALPVLLAPLRLLLGHRSDYHRSVLGWRRVPYMWLGTMVQFGGLAIMPFALIVLSGDADAPAFLGPMAAGLAFLMVGGGMQTVQTAGLALASDLAEPEKRHRVVALLYVMLLVGVMVASIAFSLALESFSQIRLIQVVQGTALVTLVLNLASMWQQEARRPRSAGAVDAQPQFSETWREITRNRQCVRLLAAVALGTAGFAMQDILLEPYGGEILRLSVAGTTVLNALVAFGALAGFALSARLLDNGGDPVRVAAYGILSGIIAMSAVVFSAPLASANTFRLGAVLLGFGTGLFSVGTLTAAMLLVRDGQGGRILGAWGAVQATAAGLAISGSGLLRDAVVSVAGSGALGPAMSGPASGYMVVFHVEIAFLFAGLVAIGPLVSLPLRSRDRSEHRKAGFGLAEFPS
ncbi:MAG TPA: BCD family MFS transporter [Hyphomicrobiaceae bacterium]|nr:BCD family MFS transporter [Hyphomicrobiaceae bacterium]